jgi:hypothetical protein
VYIGQPLIDSILPGYADNGSDILLYGKNFNKIATENRITIRDVESPGTLITEDIIKVRIPPKTFDTNYLSAEVKIASHGREDLSVIYAPAYPRILSFSPEKIHIGEILTIKGLNFIPDPDKTIVYFMAAGGAGLRANITYIDTQTIKVIVPEKSISEYFMILVPRPNRSYKHILIDAPKKITIM